MALPRNTTAIFSSPTSVQSHRIRFIMAEKGVKFDIIDVDLSDLPEDLLDLNPYGSVPTLVDRELVLYDAGILAEYLDERYPHPPLMPVDPLSRARLRLASYRAVRDWYPLIERLDADRNDDEAKQALAEQLTAASDVFAASKYLLSDEFTLADCVMGPLLWRLDAFGIDLPASAKPIAQYGRRLFRKASFQASLSFYEKELRDL